MAKLISKPITVLQKKSTRYAKGEIHLPHQCNSVYLNSNSRILYTNDNLSPLCPSVHATDQGKQQKKVRLKSFIFPYESSFT